MKKLIAKRQQQCAEHVIRMPLNQLSHLGIHGEFKEVKRFGGRQYKRYHSHLKVTLIKRHILPYILKAIAVNGTSWCDARETGTIKFEKHLQLIELAYRAMRGVQNLGNQDDQEFAFNLQKSTSIHNQYPDPSEVTRQKTVM